MKIERKRKEGEDIMFLGVHLIQDSDTKSRKTHGNSRNVSGTVGVAFRRSKVGDGDGAV